MDAAAAWGTCKIGEAVAGDGSRESTVKLSCERGTLSASYLARSQHASIDESRAGADSRSTMRSVGKLTWLHGAARRVRSAEETAISTPREGSLSKGDDYLHLLWCVNPPYQRGRQALQRGRRAWGLS